ncbi:hypothetical protein FFLO_00000 [Filobasidium floriforme]|uniref:Uncharacterized protein n=1 Tax=Filobasidium floriforme TaxID=5210 RepID=A0A8K0NTP0_9TREE|nr:hypothetical protein FFLO_00000 [Filobasidium floriforme]
MPLPQRRARARPTFHGSPIASSGSTSPASSSSLKATTAIATVARPSTGMTVTTGLKPGHLVPRKTTLDFVASSLADLDDRSSALDEDIEQGGSTLHPGPDDHDEQAAEGKDKVVTRRPIGLGELIASYRGQGRPPRGPIAHQMGFDVVPNPTQHVLVPEDGPPMTQSSHPLRPPSGHLIGGRDEHMLGPSPTSPGSLPGLSRSGETASTVSPRADDFPPILLDSQPEESDDWDLVHLDPDAWVGIETSQHHQPGSRGGSTGDDSEDELIFLDEESLAAMREEEVRRKKKAGEGGRTQSKREKLDYAAAVLKG